MSHHHTADITCGRCGHRVTIALGLASAITCPGCKTQITLGEEATLPDLTPAAPTGYRVYPCAACDSTVLPVDDLCPSCGMPAPMVQVVVAWR